MIENNFINKWRSYADQIQIDANNLILGQEKAVTLIIISLFSRGHVLLEGGVGVGKTTLLQIITKLIGGEYERVEGTVDLMPNDIIYHASINDAGKPNISNGPLLKKGENLSIFFFNEINRARPQVHSLLLRAMAEKSISAFNKDIHLPNMVVFADRNQVEKNETFELPAAARDRFMMEISIQAPKDKGLRDSIIFDNKFQNTTKLVDEIPKPNLVTLISGFTIMEFNSLNSFYVTYENEDQELPIFFNRKGLTWKITQIEFPDNLIEGMK